MNKKRLTTRFSHPNRSHPVSRSTHPARAPINSDTDAVPDYMAASRRSPLMRDQWRADGDYDERERYHHRHHHPRERDRPSRRPQSPEPSRRHHFERPSRGRGDNSSYYHSHRAISPSGARNARNTRATPSDSSAYRENRHAKQSLDNQVRPRQRGDPVPPPAYSPFPRRKRSRSPSPAHSRHRSHHSRHKRGGYQDIGDRPERGGRRPQRPHSPGRDTGHERDYLPYFKTPRSDSLYVSRRRRSRSPVPADFEPRSPPPSHPTNHFSRPLSRHSFASKASGQSSPSRHSQSMQSTRPTHSVVDEPLVSQPVFRPISSYDAASPQHSIDGDSHSHSTHSMHPSDSRGARRQTRPHVDTRPQYAPSPPYISGTDSRHTSPQSGSPYGGSRGSWTGQPSQPYPHAQQRQMPGYSPPYRQPSYASQGGSQGQYYQGQQPPYPPTTGPGPPTYSGQSPYRGSSSAYRGNPYTQPLADRRFSATSSQNYGSNTQPQRSRSGHFTSLQWTASGGRGRGAQSGPGQPPQSMPPLQSPLQAASERMSPNIDDDDDDNPFRPSKDLQVEDEESVRKNENNDSKKMPPPRQASVTSQPKEKETGKFSFAFKSKAPAAPVPKPVSGLAQKMREPPPRPAEPPKKETSSTTSRLKHDTRIDRRDDRRDRDSRRVDRRFERRDDKRRDRRDVRDIREGRDSRDARDARDGRDDRRADGKYDRRKDRERERERERPPVEEKPKKKILTRMKPRPTLPEEFSRSDSVYYRKPGNESVVGAGTYGKVFKAVHVFTKNKVALKRIRMEGEKDGFPITAVREIRLLQHLRHENVVSLQEVMVERNECFMVFEYLSHDMTGLINHPSFTLSTAHKKHLAKQMFDGLNYLHHRGVLHRDIKAANILISNEGQLKFADFGLARFFSKSRQLDYTNRVITIWYRPPELLLGETRYGPAVDVWSAACVYMEMFTKKAIFPGDGSEINQLDKLYNSLGTPTRADWPSIIDMPWFELMRPRERKTRVFEDMYREYLSPAALDLVSSIFQYDPAKRPSTEEVLAHPYFTEEEPEPQQAIELANVEGDWHEFESKAHRKEKDKEARRAEQREREKRRISTNTGDCADRERKRAKVDEDVTMSGS